MFTRVGANPLVREIIYVTIEYPTLTQTFVYREAAALQRCGELIRIYPLHLTSHAAPDESFRVLPSASAGHELLVPLFAIALRSPGRFGRCLWQALTAGRPALVGRQLFALVKAADLAWQLHRVRGRLLLHAHFARRCADVARYASTLLGPGTPWTLTVHAVDVFRPDSRRLLQRRLDSTAQLISATEYVIDYLRASRYRFGPPEIVRCGVYPRLRPAVGDGTEAAVGRLVTVGRMIEKKGWRTSLEAAVRLRAAGVQFVWDFVGDGPLLDTVRGLVHSRGLDAVVRCHGAMPNREVLRLMSDATLFVLPAQPAADGDLDGLPVVLLEAMLCEVPVVTTAVAGIPELVEHRATGWLVPPCDAGALASELQTLLGDVELRRRIGRAGRATVEKRFNSEQEASKMMSIIDRVLGASRAPADSPELTEFSHVQAIRRQPDRE